jgi:tetratricopeptide (TPR) repeat protein
MKRTLNIILILCFCLAGVCQEAGRSRKESLLKELAEKGCKCIDSIQTYNKEKADISKEIGKCIDEQAGAYQLGTKVMDIDIFSGKNSFNISLNSDKNSNEYKGYYYEVERSMMENCKTLESKMAASDLENFYSVSKNPDAKKMYAKGIKESEKENYRKAITYFQKALKIDSLFAFAWDNIGLCYRKMNNYPEAIYAYNRSLLLDPLGSMPLQNIAVAYKYNKEFDKAISAYNTLAVLDPKNPEVYYGIGLIYAFEKNDLENGLENLCKAYNLYVTQKSPYRTDAEKMMNQIYLDMKKQGKEAAFRDILSKNKITPSFNE